MSYLSPIRPDATPFEDARFIKPSVEGDRFIGFAPDALSNASRAVDPRLGGPSGGFLASLALSAAASAAAGLPLRTLSASYLGRPAFGPVELTPKVRRSGRSTRFVDVELGQAGQALMQAQLTYGASAPSLNWRSARSPIAGDPQEFPPLERLEAAPHFTRLVDYRTAAGGVPFSEAREPALDVWMRVADGQPLDLARLAFLLDAFFPAYFALIPRPIFAATADLRYDFTANLTPQSSPEGWALFAFQTRMLGEGWAVEDGSAWSPTGELLAVARQLRKLSDAGWPQ
jgi:acyl-CoA thioesterase